MSDRNWTTGTCFAYSYIFFACSDGDFADSEASTLFTKLTEWWPDTDESEFVDCCKTAHGWLMDDLNSGGPELVSTTACGVAKWLNDWMDENMEDPVAAKKAFLDDLCAIAAADNKFMPAEKDFIMLYGQALGINVEFSS